MGIYIIVTRFEGGNVSEEYHVQGTQIVCEKYEYTEENKVGYYYINYVPTGSAPVLAESEGYYFPDTLEYIEEHIYDAVWFRDLLPEKRIHNVGKIRVNGRYNGRGGLYYSEKVLLLENIGFGATWEQNLVLRMYPDKRVRDLLDERNVSASFRADDILKKRLEEARIQYGESSIELL